MPLESRYRNETRVIGRCQRGCVGDADAVVDDNGAQPSRRRQPNQPFYEVSEFTTASRAKTPTAGAAALSKLRVGKREGNCSTTFFSRVSRRVGLRGRRRFSGNFFHPPAVMDLFKGYASPGDGNRWFVWGDTSAGKIQVRGMTGTVLRSQIFGGAK